jgi:hypothetical protein
MNYYLARLKVYQSNYEGAKSPSVNNLDFANKNAKQYNLIMETAIEKGINTFDLPRKLNFIEIK